MTFRSAEYGGDKIPAKKKSTKPRKRVLNSSNGKYYAIRQRNTKYGKRGEYKGLWKPPKKTKKKKK